MKGQKDPRPKPLGNPTAPPEHEELKTTFYRDNHIPNPRSNQQANAEETASCWGRPTE